MYKILIVEDDNKIADEIGHHLIKWGYDTMQAVNLHDVISDFLKYEPQLVLMDIALPFYNGYHWCSEIRRISNVPILFISSASENMNVVMAVNMGGDDFVAKPFDLGVLAAKVQAILRRTYAFSGQNTCIEYGGILLNMSDMTLQLQHEKLELTKNEFKIMQLLFENAGGIVSRDDIMKRLWDNECFVDDNTLTVNMNRLRKRLEGIGIAELIQTKKGIGYQVKV